MTDSEYAFQKKFLALMAKNKHNKRLRPETEDLTEESDSSNISTTSNDSN